MLAHAAGVSWTRDAVHLDTILSDLNLISERSVSEERSVLMLSCIAEAASHIIAQCGAVHREALTTTLMDVYNTAHSIFLRCAALQTLTAVACEELYTLSTQVSASAQGVSQPSSATTGHSLLGSVKHEGHTSLPIWMVELVTLLMATVTASGSHRHLKQSVLLADSLNATGMSCLEELSSIEPNIRSLCHAQRSRGRAAAVAAHRSVAGLEALPPSESLRSVGRVQKFLRYAEIVHERKIYNGAPPPSRVYMEEPGIKRTVLASSAVKGPHAAKAVASPDVAAFQECMMDLVEHLDAIPRPWLPGAMRVLTLVWNYEVCSPPGNNPSAPPVSPASRLERAAATALTVNRQQKLRRRRDSPSASPSISTHGNWDSFAEWLQVDSMSSGALFAASWVASCKRKFLAPPTFLATEKFLKEDGTVAVPPAYVLRSGPDGFGLYWDETKAESQGGTIAHDTSKRGEGPWWRWQEPNSETLFFHMEGSLDPLERAFVMVCACNLSEGLRSSSRFPFLPLSLPSQHSRAPQYPCHVGWDTPQTLLLRLQQAKMVFSKSLKLSSAEVQRVVGYLRHLRDRCWYLPSVRTVLALAIAMMVTANPESFVAPAALLLASCRSAAVLHTLYAVHVYEANGDAPRSESLKEAALLRSQFTVNDAGSSGHTTYASLLSSVVMHILRNESSSRLVASFPVLSHAFSHDGGSPVVKAELLDQLAVRIQELPNTWYCGHHVVDCCRRFLVVEVNRCLRSASPALSAVALVGTVLATLDAVLKHFSDLAVAQSALLIRNAIQHLPLDTVSLLLDVSANDVQEVLTYCERPTTSKLYDAAAASRCIVHITPQTRTERLAVPDDEGACVTLEVRVCLQPPLDESREARALVGGSVELYDWNPLPLLGAGHVPIAGPDPVADIPIIVLDAYESPCMSCMVALKVPDCCPRVLYAVYRSPSDVRVALGQEPYEPLRVPFPAYITSGSLNSGTAAEHEFNTIIRTEVQDATAALERMLRGFGVLSLPETLLGHSLAVAVVPKILCEISWELFSSAADSYELLIYVSASSPQCLTLIEDMIGRLVEG